MTVERSEYQQTSEFMVAVTTAVLLAGIMIYQYGT
jgi:hypothetical protein